MIKAVIIDDEQHCISRLETLLARHCREAVAVVGTADTAGEGFELITRLQPDLVFLDIQIHDESGFDLLNRLPEIDCEIVFCTAYEKYALKAFKFSALDYLLKPVDADDLQALVSRLQLKRKEVGRERKSSFEIAMRNINSQDLPIKRIAIPTLTGFTLVRVHEIVRCRSDVNYTTLYMVDKSSLMVARTLKEFEEILEPYGFVRLHNSHLVNLQYIRQYHKGKGGFVILEDNTEIEVSVRRKDTLIKRLESL